MKNKLGVYILTHGRADNVITIKTLKKQGFTGDVFVVIDDEDEQLSEYKRRYKSKVRTFNKQKYIEATDTMDNFGRRDVVVFARNAVYDIAREDGYRYICVLDDDYKGFATRWEEDGKLKRKDYKILDVAFDEAVEFLKTSGAKAFAFAQAGDLIGGKGNGRWKNRIMRKVMNTFFFDTENPMFFMGTLNEDLVASLRENMSGELILTSVDLVMEQELTQQQKGGLTDAYLDYGTYVKSFYAVMMYPAAAKVGVMEDPRSGHGRIHHRINYNSVAPMIISDKWRK